MDGKKGKRREWDEHVTRMNTERLIRISRGNIPAGRSPGHPKSGWSDLIPVKIGGTAYKKKKRKIFVILT